MGSAPPPSSKVDSKQDQDRLLSGGFDGPGEQVNPFGQGLEVDPARVPDPNTRYARGPPLKVNHHRVASMSTASESTLPAHLLGLIQLETQALGT
ncbi:hypothetical protein CJF31_00000602 [Rutstroemia sp. NJR-2017a BVV2]|nr:hypothetical protein CJF31_00000602 [Rutstroemia sp. NJR-2017a BVV2]